MTPICCHVVKSGEDSNIRFQSSKHRFPFRCPPRPVCIDFTMENGGPEATERVKSSQDADLIDKIKVVGHTLLH